MADVFAEFEREYSTIKAERNKAPFAPKIGLFCNSIFDKNRKPTKQFVASSIKEYQARFH